ncbi:MAG: hydrolase 2, exosortase A system-associated [Kiloniellaceae bacterium]
MAYRPFFLDGPAGPLFAIYHPPKDNTPNKGGVVYVPPFAEEMNQSRRMVALQARRLAAAGVGVLLLDLYGTGDSGGDFSEARWDGWLGDVAAALDWLRAERGHPVALWGLRLGGLLALEAAAAHPGRVARIILWQPVTKGRTMLNQFLRLRVAAGMGRGGEPETTESMRRALAGGRAVEVAGYVLAPELAAAIDAAAIDGLTPPAGCRVDWLEVSPGADTASAPATRRAADAWRRKGADLRLLRVVGEPFWSLQSLYEPILVPRLLDATARLWTDAER